MSEGLNRVMLLGNLGDKPELRFTQGGQAVLNMRLATTESYLDKDRMRRERTDWHNVVVWGKRGEGLAKFLDKGMGIFVEGSIRTSSYDDRDGNKRYKTEIIASNVLVTGNRGRGQGDQQEGGGGGDERAPRDNGGSHRGGGGSRGGGGGRAPVGPPPEHDGGGGGDYSGDGYGGGGSFDDDIPF